MIYRQRTAPRTPVTTIERERESEREREREWRIHLQSIRAHTTPGLLPKVSLSLSLSLSLSQVAFFRYTAPWTPVPINGALDPCDGYFFCLFLLTKYLHLARHSFQSFSFTLSSSCPSLSVLVARRVTRPSGPSGEWGTFSRSHPLSRHFLLYETLLLFLLYSRRCV